MSESNYAPFLNGSQAFDTNTYSGAHRDSKAESSDDQQTEQVPAQGDVAEAIRALGIFAHHNGVVTPCYIPIGNGASPVSKQIALEDQKALKAFLEDAMREGNAYFHPNAVEVFQGPFEDPRDKVEAQRRAEKMFQR